MTRGNGKGVSAARLFGVAVRMHVSLAERLVNDIVASVRCGTLRELFILVTRMLPRKLTFAFDWRERGTSYR